MEKYLYDLLLHSELKEVAQHRSALNNVKLQDLTVLHLEELANYLPVKGRYKRSIEALNILLLRSKQKDFSHY